MDIRGSTCTVCRRNEAFFLRPYSGERLCRKCFTHSIEARVAATLANYKMLRYDDRVAVAVSGGKDSVSLLQILAKMERKYPSASLVGVTVDEGIRGYRDEALRIAGENCRKLGIEHHVVSFEELFGLKLDEIVARLAKSRKRGITACACCGVLRRKALNLAARQVVADKLATGHTLDDEAQTILLNIFHGDVFRIAKEKPVTDEVHPRLVQKVKPLCEVPEKETALYAYVKGIEFQSSPCPYASEAMRNDVRVMLNRMEEKRAGIKFTVFKSMERIRPAIAQVAKEDSLGECVECGEPSAERVCRACQLLGRLR